MQKHISGVPNTETKEIREIIKQANLEFKQSLIHLRGKKEESKHIKENNNKLRAVLIREKKLAEMFKVKEFTKKQPFLPSLSQRGEFHNESTLEIGVPYLDGHTKAKLTYPDRSSPKKDAMMAGWKIQRSISHAFQTDVRQEKD